MANTIKGEVGFRAGATTFTLLYDFNALCQIEDALDVDIDQIGEHLKRINNVRTVFRIGLAAAHGQMTDLEAGNLIHQVGVKTAFELVQRALKAAFPDPSGDDGSAEGNESKPGTSRRR